MKSKKYFYYPRLSVNDKLLCFETGVFFIIIERHKDRLLDTCVLQSYDGQIEFCISTQELIGFLSEKRWYKLPIFPYFETPKNRLATVD